MWNSRTFIILGVVLLLSGLGYLGLRRSSNAGGMGDKVYFYNLKTGKLFPASNREIPPINTDSGPDTGVRAYVFTCPNSKDQDGQFVGYLEKLTADGRRALMEEVKADKSPFALRFAQDQHRDAMLVRSPQNETWYPEFSPQGQAVIKAGEASGGCAHPMPALP